MSADGQSYHGFIIYRADVTGGLGSDSRAVCPKRLAMLTGWKWFVMDGIPAICSEHVPGQAITRQRKGIATAVRQQFQWDSQDTCSHHGASHAAAGGRQASRCGIISQSGQANRACLQAESGLRVLGSRWSQLVAARQGDERHCDCPRRAPAGA